MGARYTPFLDARGITFNEDAPNIIDNLLNIVDSCLKFIERSIEWGEWGGRRRRPCPEQPILLTGQAIGQYHCPCCGMMVMAGMPHLSPAAPPKQHPDYPLADYEEEYGREWPPGYEYEEEAPE